MYNPLASIKRLWRQHVSPLSPEQSNSDMSQWFTTALGRALLQEQKATLNQSLNCLFGYHLLQLGVSAEVDMSAQIRIAHRFVLHPQTCANRPLAGVAQFTQLPLANESIDAVILHHTLDYSAHPHSLLREAARVIIPRGHLVIIGFNPWSLWGLSAAVARLFSRHARWRFRGVRLGRLLDWLSLLNYEVVETQQGFYRPPLSQPKAIQYLHWLDSWGKRWRLPGGSFYMVVARNDHLALTPLKPHWQAPLPLRGMAVPRILRQGDEPGASVRPEAKHDTARERHSNKKTAIENSRNIH